MSLSWMVIYPRGNKELLDIVEVVDYEKEEWSLASYNEFSKEEDAALYAQKLSKKHSIKLNEKSDSRLLHILDLEEEDEQSIY